MVSLYIWYLKPVMQSGKSYIKDTGHFLEKIKSLGCIPDNAILVTADLVGLGYTQAFLIKPALLPLRKPLTRVFRKRYLLMT